MNLNLRQITLNLPNIIFQQSHITFHPRQVTLNPPHLTLNLPQNRHCLPSDELCPRYTVPLRVAIHPSRRIVDSAKIVSAKSPQCGGGFLGAASPRAPAARWQHVVDQQACHDQAQKDHKRNQVDPEIENVLLHGNRCAAGTKRSPGR